MKDIVEIVAAMASKRNEVADPLDLFLDVAVFYNSYDDLLSVEPQEFVVEAEPPPPHLLLPVLFRNRVMGSTGGFEIAPVWTAASWLRLKGAYSYLHLDFETEPGSGDQSTVAQIEGSSPGHQIVAQSLMELPRELELDFTYRFVSDLPYRMADAYHTADLRLSWSASESLVLSFVGRNLASEREVQMPLVRTPVGGVEGLNRLDGQAI